MPNKKIDDKPIGKVIFHSSGRKMSTEEVCLGFLGITRNQLVADIIENRDGKYDELYASPALDTKGAAP